MASHRWKAISQVTAALERRSGLIIAVTAALTIVLAIPMVLMEPTSTASQDPGGTVFNAQDRIAERFVSNVFETTYLVEARDGNVLARPALTELLTNLEALRADEALAGMLLDVPTPAPGITVPGTFSFADAINGVFKGLGYGGVSGTSDDILRLGTNALLNSRRPFELGLSALADFDEAEEAWVAPALLFRIEADNAALGGGSNLIQLGSDDTTKEEFAREVLAVLRGDQEAIEVWGIAIDVNLTSAEQGEEAGPFIALTIVAVLLLVGYTFRSYWVVAICGAGVAALMIWLKGLSNLIGLERDQLLTVVVPIAMVSFGIDFAFHSVGRYREEESAGRPPRRAFVVGQAAVIGALFLAFASDAVAFLANLTSGIESIIGFGIATTIALGAAFFVLGIVTPLALVHVEERIPYRRHTGRAGLLVAVGALVASLVATASFMLSVFLAPVVGVAVLIVYVLVFLVAPIWVVERRPAGRVATGERHGAGGGSARLGRLVAATVRFRAVLVPVVLILTAVAAVFATRVEAEFDVKDFFDPASEFVVGLDRFDLHVGEQGGERADVYIEGDLSQPGAREALDRFLAEIAALDTARLARDDEGAVQIETGASGILSDVFGSPEALDAVFGPGADPNPDSVTAIAAVYEYALENGVPGTDASADTVRSQLWAGPDPGQYATRIGLRLPGTRTQSNIEVARAEIEPLVDEFEAELRAVDPDASAVFTGSPIVRQAGLDAVFRALLYSLPISVILCFAVAAGFMRSVRFGLIVVIPILLVVAWLYAFMYAFDFSVNLVTATIGAISIGIGIDFAIHFTERFRHELTVQPDRIAAIEATGAGTGQSLLASALSSIIGFLILAFAPMPLFSAFGVLTAVMIFLAAVASLLVLPSLLMLVTRDEGH